MGSRILDFPVISALNCGLTRPAGLNLVKESYSKSIENHEIPGNSGHTFCEVIPGNLSGRRELIFCSNHHEDVYSRLVNGIFDFPLHFDFIRLGGGVRG